MRRTATALFLLALVAGPTTAQHAGHRPGGSGAPAPYASFEAREAAGLSAEETADLRAGRGMGLALPAELNGYPGPLHALELADRLGLSADQRTAMTRQVGAMRVETIPLGEAVIVAERRLDAVFRSGRATAVEVDAAATGAAAARGRLRAAHLRTHLATRDALTAEQRTEYARLRGYAP